MSVKYAELKQGSVEKEMEAVRKILFCATIDYHFKAFHLPYMRWFHDQGWEVHVAAKGNIELPYCDMKYDLPIERSPFKLVNFKSYKCLKKIIDQNRYSIIHAHTPMGGVLTRLAARQARKKGTKVLYTAHGFHFCKGAPWLNWIIYYPLERWLAHYTDCLITINNEDYNLAVNHHFKAGRIEHVHGVGVDTEKFQPVSQDEKNKLREKHDYSQESYILFYAAELNKNKNQGMLIKALSEFKKDIPQVKLLLAGIGPMEQKFKQLTQDLNVINEVDFLGLRGDVDELVNMSDVIVASSFREGLPVNIMEAMACGKPVVVSNNRGHKELVENGINGFVINVDDQYSFVTKLYELYKSLELQKQFSFNTVSKMNTYALSNVMKEMKDIYSCLIS